MTIENGAFFVPCRAKVNIHCEFVEDNSKTIFYPCVEITLCENHPKKVKKVNVAITTHWVENFDEISSMVMNVNDHLCELYPEIDDEVEIFDSDEIKIGEASISNIIEYFSGGAMVVH